MARPTKAPINPDDAPLRRLGGGRWQTRDERFTIEPQSGTWVIVDAEQTDDFGMALVRGPFPSLNAAKEAISTARASAPAASPLAAKIERRHREPAPRPEPKQRATRSGRAANANVPGNRKSATGAASRAAPAGDESAEDAAPASVRDRSIAASKADERREPAWLDDLGATERGRARRLIARLQDEGVSDAEGLVRRDVVGDVPALAAHALARRLAALAEDASTREVAELLADGRDEGLGVRWRLVDGDGRQILLDPSARRRR